MILQSFLFKQMFGACCVLFPVLIYVQYYTVSHMHALNTMGRVCAVGSICSYGSPLSAMVRWFIRIKIIIFVIFFLNLRT